MDRPPEPRQQLDRVAFTAYFLGAVVPLAALVLVVEHFVLPAIDDRFAMTGLIGAVFFICVLSLASFLSLRRTTLRSLVGMDRSNRHLTTLLDAAGHLAGAGHGSDAAESAARDCIALCDARACFVMMRTEPGAPPVRLAAAGADADRLEVEIAEPLVTMATLVMSQDRPGLREAEPRCAALAAVPIAGEAAPVGAIVVVAQDDVDAVAQEDIDALATLGGLASVALHNGDLKDAQRNFFTHVTDMLVSALDSSLGYHAGHGTRVAQYANRLGRALGLDERRMQRLHFAALLHDVGLLKLDRDLQINRRTASSHALLGGRMLARIRLWQDLAPIVQHHHEWWDGSGYPDGLSGEAIPLESRIIAVCDVFDTITSQKSYRDARPFGEAVHEIVACAGRQFDPEVVTAFEHLVREGEITPNAF